MLTLSLTRPITISRTLNQLLVLITLFPFVPAVIRSSDTQPYFLGVFALLVVTALAVPGIGSGALNVSLPAVMLGLAAALTLYLCLFVANVVQTPATIPSRAVAFVQFAVAAVWGYSTKFEIDSRLLIRALVVYALFTVIFFLTDGVVEDLLIRSRGETSGDLLATGRGARTLSPEPSFFALQVFNIFVLSRVLRLERTFSRRESLLFLALLVFCLVASFSAYGALLLLGVLFAFYPRTFVVVSAVAVAFFGVLYQFLPNWDSIRAVKIIVVLIESRGEIAELMLLDPSFGSRIGSFLTYVDAFRAHPLSGEGFALFQGGGFVSLIAGFGVLGLLFFTVLSARIVTGRWPLSTKALLLAWFLLYFISGPIGVPILGVIVGKLFLNGRSHAAGSLERSAVALAT